MIYKLYETRKINIDKELLHKIIEKFSEIKNKSGTFQVNNKQIKYNFLGKGGQGIVFSLEIDDNTIVAIKRCKSNKNENENALLKLMSGYVDSQIAPHFLLIYNILDIDDKDCIVMEKIDGDLNKWLEETHSDNEWMSFLFQILISVYVMKNYAKTFHNDLKPKNILFKNINEKRAFLEYRLGNNTYFVPLFDKLFIVGDFGHSQSLLLDKNAMSNNQIKEKLDNNVDLYNIYTLIKRMKVDNIVKNFTINELIGIFEQNKINYLDYYNKEKRKIDNDLRIYNRKIKNDMLLKSLAYYVIENELYEQLTFKIPSKFKLPSKTIQDFIENKFDGKKNPEDIIKEHYGRYMKDDKQNIVGTFNLA